MDVMRIRELMRAAGMNQHDLAREIGCSQSSVSNMMTGKREPRVSLFKRLCKALGCDPRDIW